MNLLNRILKRLIDLLGALFGVFLLSPLFILIAMAIKIDSKGPVFFRQERLGKKGKVFKIWKFRTMIVNAENLGGGLTVSQENDSRITNVGKVLRKLSLDEIPQLLNVLKGDMSIVGPRPPAVYFPYKGYDNYPEWTLKRFQFKPGITGLAQVTVRNSVDWDERIKIDIIYIDSFNVISDLKIIFLTIIKVLKPNTIYGKTKRK